MGLRSLGSRLSLAWMLVIWPYIVKSAPLSLDTAQVDRLPGTPYWQMGVAPATLFSASALSWGYRKEAREIRNRYIPNFRSHYDDYLQYAPAVGVFALKAAGVKGRNRMGRAAVSYIASIGVMALLVNSLKYTTKVVRPDGSKANSFPSGHTSNAFMNATFLHKEYGFVSPVYSIAGYTAGSLTGIGRNLNNRHWISDVLAGAGIGILSTQLAYLFVDRLYKDEGDWAGIYTSESTGQRPSFLSLKLGYAHATKPLVDYFELGASSERGFELGLEGAFYISRNWGIAADFAFVSFPIHTSDRFDLPESQSQFEILTQPMGGLRFAIGPHYTYQVAPKYNLQMKLTGGVLGMAKGNVLVKWEGHDDDNNVLNDEFEVVNFRPKRTWTAGTGLALTRMLNRELGVSVYGDYYYARPLNTYETLPSPLDPQQEYYFKETGRTPFSYFTGGLRISAFF